MKNLKGNHLKGTIMKTKSLIQPSKTQQVRRLHIAVNQRPPMAVPKGSNQVLHPQVDALHRLDAMVPLAFVVDPVVQITASAPLHVQVADAVKALDVIEGGDVRVVQPGCHDKKFQHLSQVAMADPLAQKTFVK